MVERLSSDGWERWPQRKTLDGSQYLCRWCAKLLTGQKTSYCSPKCQHEIETRCSWNALRFAIYNRDGGICKKCGINLDDLEEFFKWYSKIFRKYSTNPPDSANYDYYHKYGSVVWVQHWPLPRELQQALGYSKDHLYEINHIKGLAEGGDLLDPENLETLCVPCHKKHTAALRKRLKGKMK